jgi:RimJ/RimL family protein N-acetyltransferase
MAVIRLETPRLILRELERDDLDPVAEMLAHPEVMRYWPRPCSREEAREWILRQQERYQRDGYGYWLAILRESGLPVGQIGVLRQEFAETVEVGLGYILHRPFWGFGYAFEGAAACRDYVFETLGMPRAIALIRPENLRSQAVARRLGMTAERMVRYYGFDHLVFVSYLPDTEKKERR